MPQQGNSWLDLPICIPLIYFILLIIFISLRYLIIDSSDNSPGNIKYNLLINNNLGIDTYNLSIFGKGSDFLSTPFVSFFGRNLMYLCE